MSIGPQAHALSPWAAWLSSRHAHAPRWPWPRFSSSSATCSLATLLIDATRAAALKISRRPAVAV